MFNKLVGNNRNNTKVFLAWLPLMASLIGCQASPAEWSASAVHEFRSIRVVAVESPPLEVMPDLLESRMTVYRHYRNMVLPICPEVAVYKNPGGILIAGRIGQDDSVKPMNFPEEMKATDKILNLQNAAFTSDNWLPTLELAKLAVAHLRSNQMNGIDSRYWLRLPLKVDERGADLVRWRDAVAQWYESRAPTLDYRTLDDAGADAVLEVGIGRYRIFTGQLTLQVLIKLIDTGTGQVVARSNESIRSFDVSAETLLAHEGEAFKKLIRDRGMRLMAKEFQAIGLTFKPVKAPLLPISS